MPGYVVLLDNANDPPGGSRNWGTGFMPAVYQGVRFATAKHLFCISSRRQMRSALRNEPS